MRVLVPLAMVLSACTSSPIATSDVRPPKQVVDSSLLVASPEKGRIVIKRDSGGAFGPRSCSQLISIDGKPALELGDQQGATLYVTPGERILRLTFTTWICDTGDSQVAVTVAAGQTKTVRSVVNAGGIATLQQASN